MRSAYSFCAPALLPAIACFLVSCSGPGEKHADKPTAYHIKGNASEVPGAKKVYLTFLADTAKTLLDSAELDAKGEFILQGKAPEYGLYSVFIPVGEETITSEFPLDSNTVTLNFSVSKSRRDPDFDPASSASPEMQHFADFRKTFMSFQKQGEGLKGRYSSASESKDEKAMAAVVKTYDSLTKAYIVSLKHDIAARPTKPLSVFFTRFLDFNGDIGFLDSIAGKIKDEKVKGIAIDYFLKKVEMAKRTSPGALAPELSLKTPVGKDWKLSELRGQVVLLDFWASWCGPCRRANPEVVALYKKFKDRGFTVAGISLDEDMQKWRKAIVDDKLTWPHASDLKGWYSSAAKIYKVESIPTSFLLDKNGVIVARDLSHDELEAKIEELLAKK
ncbi:MAG: TlpA disulfide reductase family protein [Bacteroidota bacterium]